MNYSINNILVQSSIRYKDRQAVSNGSKSFTFAELFANADEIALELMRLNVERNDVVVLRSSPDPMVIACIIAILKCEATYLPISSQTPKKRAEKIYRECGAKYEIEVDQTTGEYSIRIISGYDECKINTATRIAYIIYTSGSTGFPKGVMIKESSLLNLIYGLKEVAFNMYSDRENVALLSPIYFDASIKNIFLSLVCGKTLYIVDESIKHNARKLVNFYHDNAITITDGTASLIDILIDASKKIGVTLMLKLFLIGGEVLTPKLLVKIFSLPWFLESKVINLYGPTECCVDSTYFLIDKSIAETLDDVPIGYPMPNYNVYVLSNDLQKKKNYEKGVIFISGIGVAEGYINDQNSSLFFQSPFEDSIMYNSGDIGYFDERGALHYYGRTDSQQKINGFRIDLSEIRAMVERVLENKCRVEVVISEKSNFRKIIVCFIESADKIEDCILTAKLKEYIYEYMMPAQFVFLDQFPINANGKVDVEKLVELSM